MSRQFERGKFAPLLATAIAAWTLVSAAWATNPNTTAADAVAYEIDQGWVTTSLESATTGRWFVYGEMAGHSYCLETATGSLSPIAIDSRIDVYSDTSGTTFSVSGSPVANDVPTGEPLVIDGARACYIAPGSQPTTNLRYVKISSPGMAAGDTGYIKFRIQETTLFAPYFVAATNSGGTAYQGAASSTTRFRVVNNVRGVTIHLRVITMPTSPSFTGVDYTWSVPDCLCDVLAPTYPSLWPYLTGTASTTGITGKLMISHDGPPGSIDAWALKADSSLYYQLHTR